jgi:hypothetical protein
MTSPRPAIALLALLHLAACGGPPAPVPPPSQPALVATSVTVALPPPPPAESPPVPVAAATSCGGDLAPDPPDFTPPRDDRASPLVPGQPTEAMAQARRLMDAERWTEALARLDEVISGQTGDDAGNQEIAAFLVAKTLYRLGRREEALTAFRPLAQRRSHLKHAETMLWIIKLAGDAKDPRVRPSDFSSYDRQDVARFDNAPQRELYFAAAYFLGRSRMEHQRLREAVDLFSLVPRDSPFGERAARCRDAAGALAK